jgi:hypothetical protein
MRQWQLLNEMGRVGTACSGLGICSSLGFASDLFLRNASNYTIHHAGHDSEAARI